MVPVVAPERPETAATRMVRPLPESLRQALLADALAFQGIPYRNGGADPAGFDCSGFVQYVFGRHGIVLPRDVRSQFDRTIELPPDQAQAGDLVFFATIGPSPSHVGILLDAHRFIHAPSSTGVIRIETIGRAYWRARFVGFRRVVAADM